MAVNKFTSLASLLLPMALLPLESQIAMVTLCLQCNSSVDCHSPHDWDNSISLLASIYIEDCLESASHNSYFFVRCKIKL